MRTSSTLGDKLHQAGTERGPASHDPIRAPPIDNPLYIMDCQHAACQRDGARRRGTLLST